MTTKFIKIALWEMNLRVRSKSFLFSTLFMPVLFAAIIYIPTLHLESEESFKVGFVNASPNDFIGTLKMQIKKVTDQPIELIKISADSLPEYQQMVAQRKRMEVLRDSVSRLHNAVYITRRRLFTQLQRRKNKDVEARLIRLYDVQSQAREERDSLTFALKNLDARITQTYVNISRARANQMLRNESINAYIYLGPDVLEKGAAEFHSLNPGYFTIRDQFEQLVTNLIFQYRLLNTDLEANQTDEILKPVTFETFQVRENQILSSSDFANYYGPVIAVMLMFISIFTSVGYLFSSLVTEKNNRILEFVLSTVTKSQLFSGKIIGMYLVGLIQMVIWTSLFIGVYQLGVFDLPNIHYLTLPNLIYYFTYFTLGYFLLAYMLGGVSVIYMSEQESQNLNQFIRIAAIFPLLFAFIILDNPNSDTIRILSYIPVLSPAFMVMRIPLSPSVPLIDIQWTIAILIVSNGLLFYFAARLFNAMSVYYGRRPTVSQISRALVYGRI